MGATSCVGPLPLTSGTVDTFPVGDNGDLLLIAIPGTEELVEASIVGDTATINHSYVDEGDPFLTGDEAFVDLYGTLTVSADGNTIGGLDPANTLTVDITVNEEFCTGELNLLLTR